MMDLRYLLIILGLEILCVANGDNMVFQVERRKMSLSGIKHLDHHGGIGLNLSGNVLPSETGAYFTKLGLGSPKKDYYVQVDTGSDIMWVNCVGCSSCPRHSVIVTDLTRYDPKESHTSELISCDHDFCSSTHDAPIPGCKAGTPCPYNITYEDASATTGYYVRDYLTFDRVNGNLHTAPQNSSIIFGCGTVQSGVLDSSSFIALDGIIGFGQGNSSVLSQLAASRKVKKIFSHCLDTIRGGGIFSIGELVEPKVSTTPLVPNMAHYSVVLKNIEVDGDVLQLPSDIFDSANGVEIDSGTTFAYLPAIVYDQLLTKIFARQPGLKVYDFGELWKCFPYAGNVDGEFPVVKLHFEGSLSLTVYPHDYLFLLRLPHHRCIGWMKSVTQTKYGKDMTILGDLVLSNKLVLYDLENMAIGWTEYNCSSSIKVKDATTGKVHTVGAHNTAPTSTFLIGRILSFFLLLPAMLISFYN